MDQAQCPPHGPLEGLNEKGKGTTAGSDGPLASHCLLVKSDPLHSAPHSSRWILAHSDHRIAFFFFFSQRDQRHQDMRLDGSHETQDHTQRILSLHTSPFPRSEITALEHRVGESQRKPPEDSAAPKDPLGQSSRQKGTWERTAGLGINTSLRDGETGPWGDEGSMLFG